MQVRFRCPACKGTHVADIPETTVQLTCSRTNRALQLRVTTGGDVKSVVLNNDGTPAQIADEDEA